ncbi:urea carboxylase-associated family protein [Frankia sp. AgB1.9]|uniref:urea amidolyase associated protein UAAP1 n=1 Tax=unclassified Frankia TaxID=2632575 RepID=UPI00193156D7|nr:MULTISPECIES: urea amidolyase associated protein UAAP1 [unclassified Frankia]MBL7489637.1 urea carboxylase-associated family protein [Frankia sp. AgW1.1]MBL7549397.1 urea carboxylase-associated family protein [Frankia sp. AgB1.9]MBL7623115.1 urea carboxylase-associated family protein [Frankia sp. AgB1.8]
MTMAGETRGAPPRDEHLTDSVRNARADARAQGGQTSAWMPYLPASTSPFCPAEVDPATLVWAETVAPGGYTHKVLAAGSRLRFDDPTGDACAHVIVYNAAEPVERLNVADTQKIPWQAYLGAGHPLLSGDGRVLATIVADSSGHHDAFCGTSTDAFNERKYGDARPEGPAPSGRALFVKAAAKHGLARRDLPPSVSFFQGVRVAADGALDWRGSAGAGTHVELVAELPLLVLVANVAHPLDPRADYVVGPLRVHAWRGAPTGPGDQRFAATPELNRAYLNTVDYREARGL